MREFNNIQSGGYAWACRSLLGLGITALVACGGGDGTSRLDNLNGNTSGSQWQQGVFKPEADFKNKCAAPRSGTDPFTGERYPDRRGNVLDENNWLRSWSNNTYLWYNEITDRNPALYDDPLTYFDLLKTMALTPTGAPKDQFHFTYDTADWNALSGSGMSAGYGVSWSIVNGIERDVRVAYTEPNTPATAEGIELARGARVLSVNGVSINDNTNAGLAVLNSVLFPAEAGQVANLVVMDVGAEEERSISMTSAVITSTPVQQVKTVESESGELIGYMLFNDHIATSQELLVDAIDELSSAGATALVLDLRYNGGGLLAIASQLAYMITGEDATQGQPFYNTSFNDKHPDRDPVTGEPLEPLPFIDITLNYGNGGSGQSLPSLNLQRVYVLTGPDTCSASEAIINGLRGVDVEVIQIGNVTCGKPYGFYPTDNCGTTYFTVQMKGVNAKGFGEYSDGFAPANNPDNAARVPGCVVADDYDHLLGDPLEARFAAALTYHETGECPVAGAASVGVQKRTAPLVKPFIYKPQGLRSNILLIPDTSARP